MPGVEPQPTNRRIWLIGGTQESAELGQIIAEAHLPCTITVTTESARSLYLNAPSLDVQVGRFNSQALLQFLRQQQIAAILDASHPFAVEISELAIALAAQMKIPYLRYERPGLEGNPQQAELPEPDSLERQPITYLDSFATLIEGDYLAGQRVLLTVGYRPLHWFQVWQERATLFARILPSVTALEAAFAAGFTSDRLIALRPPISLELERSLWQQWQISMVVTKASGIAGGEVVKQQVAAELGVPLLTIARPPVTYSQQTSDLMAALDFCKSSLRCN